MSVFEKQILRLHPVMFRKHPIWFLICLALISAYGLGILFLVFWWLSCINTTLTVTNKRTILRRGIVAKHTREIFHQDVRYLEVKQSALNRLFGVGSIAISSAGQGVIELEVGGVLNPEKAKEIIIANRS